MIDKPIMDILNDNKHSLIGDIAIFEYFAGAECEVRNRNSHFLKK